MVQQYHDFPLDIVNNFNSLPRQPRERPRPCPSTNYSRIVRDNSEPQPSTEPSRIIRETTDEDSQRLQASQLLSQQSRITDMHVYQAATLSLGQSFGPFQVVETTPAPWPAPSTPAPQPTVTYMNTPLPETPR